MSRGVFQSNNKVGETFTFQVTASSAVTVTPTILMLSPQPSGRRPQWNWGDGTSIDGGESVTHVYNDSGILKTITVGTNRLKDFNTFSCNSFQSGLYGTLDMSGFENLSQFNIGNINSQQNTTLTAITHTYSPQNFTTYAANRNNITGNHDLSMFPNLGNFFSIWGNNNLTGITHTASTQIFSSYRVDSCNITGTHDVSMLTNLSGVFRTNSNPNLTNLLLTGNNNIFTQFHVDNCNLTGNFDLSMFPNLGGTFRIYVNPNLTGVTHTASTQTFTQYRANNCNLTGNFDLSMFPNLGGTFYIYSNPNLTGITHTTSTQIFTSYLAYSCNLTGNFDLSMFPNLGGQVWFFLNPNLTGVTHTASTQSITEYLGYNCNLTGSHDISMLTNLGGFVQLRANPLLTDILLPNSTNTFRNNGTTSSNYAFVFSNCDLGYVNFLPLSGATLDNNYVQGCSINLSNNNMTAAEVNHILVDFSANTSNNLSGWSGVTALDIGGTNAAPDTTSGGYNGIAAINYLTGATAQWQTIITS
jgi:hypothetical protein